MDKIPAVVNGAYSHITVDVEQGWIEVVDQHGNGFSLDSSSALKLSRLLADLAGLANDRSWLWNQLEKRKD